MYAGKYALPLGQINSRRELRSSRARPVRQTPAGVMWVLAVFLLAPLLAPLKSAEAAYAYSAPLRQENQALELGEYAYAFPKSEVYAAEAYMSKNFVGFSGPLAPAPSPDSIQAWALGRVNDYGWDYSEFTCLVSLWNRESGWNPYAQNPSSGAYGIPQSLPGTKMATVADDWQTNPQTQVEWGLRYIAGRFGSPCGAWQHSELKGWY